MNQPGVSDEMRDEMRKQALAEAAERAGAGPANDADVEFYRQVLRAAARPLHQQLPTNFAEGIAAMVAAEEAPSMLDRLAPGLCFVVLLIAGIATSGEFLLGLTFQLVDLGSGRGADRVPWSLLGAALLSLAAVGLSDRVLHGRRS